MFVQPNSGPDDDGEGSDVGSWQMLPVELAEPFLLSEPVELGWDDGGGALVGGPGELNGTVGYWNCLNTRSSDTARIGGECRSRLSLARCRTVAVPASRSRLGEA